MIFSYARVSTIEQATAGTTSIDEQQRKCRSLAMLRNVDPFSALTFVDAGVSGSIPLHQRPAGKEMLASAKSGDVLVAAKLDRMFRSASDALNTIESLRKKGIEVVLLDIDMQSIGTSPVSLLFFTILSAVAEFERARIADRMSDGRKGKAARGGHLGGPAPYGTVVIGTGRESRTAPNESEQVIQLEVARLRRTSMAPYQICKELNSRVQYRTRSGKPWKISQVQRILKKVEVNG